MWFYSLLGSDSLMFHNWCDIPEPGPTIKIPPHSTTFATSELFLRGFIKSLLVTLAYAFDVIREVIWTSPSSCICSDYWLLVKNWSHKMLPIVTIGNVFENASLFYLAGFVHKFICILLFWKICHSLKAVRIINGHQIHFRMMRPSENESLTTNA